MEDSTDPLSKPHDPKRIEEKWYRFWEENRFFVADAHSSKPAYCISIPPPNVTGVLHMGHALVDTLQDILIRWKRMMGFEVLWVPGTDHAGIATQTVVERHLISTVQKRRKDFSREEFLAHVWKWKESSESSILSQLKKLGCSCDWSRLAFTMDPARNRAVRYAFKKMFDQKLIYRGDYLVNWDPVTQTALADDEVEHEEKESFLWYFRYPLANDKKHLVIATTRPETLLGDVALAVSPQDERYRDLIGRHVVLPLMNREIPIIADHHVDPEFGTGVVKVTPAHDPNDYEMGITHGLPMINIMTPDGKINENGGEFVGMTMAEARDAVVEAMRVRHLIEKIDPHTHRVGVSYRSKAVIEPYLSKQWFVKMSGFRETLKGLVETQAVRLIPASWDNTYFHWIDHLRDWCISRQLWWGHRIPIWYRKDHPEEMICLDEGELPPEGWVQDEDVLDTWFSSALWPMSILGWPDQTPDFSKFYPNATLITGHDILFFWVARMLLMGSYLLETPPFPEVFLHGLIYGKSYWKVDAHGLISYVTSADRIAFDLGQKPLPPDMHYKWEKMSKSKGNIIDPLEMIDIYGTDAVRMGLCASATHARQIDLDRRRFEEYKNFINKVWNSARFVFMHIESLSPAELTKELKFELEDQWILSRLNHAIRETNEHLAAYSFDKVAATLYHFVWSEFCAYYLELIKPILFGKMGTPAHKTTKQQMLTILLSAIVRLLHPLAPFVTEELFQRLKTQFGSALKEFEAPACMLAPFPSCIYEKQIDSSVEKTFDFLNQVVYALRNIRAEMQLPPHLEIDLYVKAPSHHPDKECLFKHESFIRALVRLKEVRPMTDEIAFSATAVVGALTLIVPLPDEFREKERVRLNKERDKLIAQDNRIRQQLANAEFMEKAPQALVEKFQSNLQNIEKELAETMRELQRL